MLNKKKYSTSLITFLTHHVRTIKKRWAAQGTCTEETIKPQNT